MFRPLSDCTTRQCNRSFSALFAVSEGLIADVRRPLDDMCSNPSLEHPSLLECWKSSQHKHPRHPMNRFGDCVGDRIEIHLNMVLRGDPAGSTGV